MKRFIALLLTLIMSLSLMTNVTFAAGNYKPLESIGNYGNMEYIYDNMEVKYNYNGETVWLDKDDMTYEEFEVMFTVLSDEKLSFKDIKTTESIEENDDLFPQKGYVIFLDENDGNWIVAFDENEVYARCIDPINKTSKQGFFSYKLDTTYNSFRAFLDNIVIRNTNDIENTPNNPTEDKPSEPETKKHENQINVYDMKQIYSASFPIGFFRDNFSWGICSYTRENETSPVTLAYLTFEDMEFIRVLTENEVKDNKIVFDTKRVAYFKEGTDGIEYDMNFHLSCDFELQVNVNGKGQVEYAIITVKNVYSGAAPETEVIDMSKYKQSGYLPTSGKISFKSSNNMKFDESKADRPVISINENGDEVVKVGGTNLDDVKKEILQNVELMEENSYIDILVDSDEESFQAEHRYTSSSSKKELKNFVEGLFEEIYLQTASGTPTSVKGKSHCYIKLRHKVDGKWVLYSTSFWFSDSAVEIDTENHGDIELSIKNADVILDYLSDYSKNKFTTYKKETTDESAPYIRGNIEGLTKTDIIEFEFKLPNDTDNSISTEVASPGKTVKGMFERYKENQYRSTYILTLLGNIGTISFYNKTQSSLDGEQEKFSNNIPLSFSNRFRYENGNTVEYKVGKEGVYYDLKMVFKSGDISEVYFEDIKCSDLKYTQLTEDTKLSDEFVEKDKEVVIREAKECADTLYEFGLFKGTDKGYELEKSLTREESATILVRLLGEEEKVDADDFDEVFVDVYKDRWSYAYVMYCYKHNITKGTGADTFSPDVQIDANQFITLMMRLLGYTEVNPDTALEKSVEYKLLPEEKIDDLTKKKVFTRSDMVQIVYNSLKTKMDDETVFADYLLEKGILTEKEIEQIK